MNTINFRSPKTLGCSVASSVIIQSLKEKFPESKIAVYTKMPDLFIGLTEMDELIDLNKEKELTHYDVDLENYLETKKPQLSKPLRHLIEHMFEETEEQLSSLVTNSLNRDFVPKVNLNKDELNWAITAVSALAQDKPLIWLQTKSRLQEKDAPAVLWQELVDKCADKYSFIDLSQEQYSRRQSIAITKIAAGGATLDTFLLHGSEAVRARNVIVLLVSSHQEVVCYPDQICLTYSKDSDSQIVNGIINVLDNAADALANEAMDREIEN
jgi:hypothetical protein